MTLTLVTDTTVGDDTHLVNVPVILRNLAAAIERGGNPIPHCVTIVWFENGAVEIASAGMRSDGHDTHMLLTQAADQMRHNTFHSTADL